MAGANRFEDLTVWQRMLELNLEVRKATTRSAAGCDFRLANQIRHAVDSAERNVAEGFGRFDPTECAHFLNLSRASTLETRTLLTEGLAVGYFTEDDFARLDALATRGLQALDHFERYLRPPFAPRAGCGHPGTREREPNDEKEQNVSSVSSDLNRPQT
jgi:four helix bundle protein